LCVGFHIFKLQHKSFIFIVFLTHKIHKNKSTIFFISSSRLISIFIAFVERFKNYENYTDSLGSDVSIKMELSNFYKHKQLFDNLISFRLCLFHNSHTIKFIYIQKKCRDSDNERVTRLFDFFLLSPSSFCYIFFSL
jgi:hypothetical protein